ncbi:collagen-binding domain-containing protein [Pseudooceanicola sp. LIPI14-2-Ac024]|uniref:collagen-binding domain-containing protein n=1 Tax=Pseudooceanicola sp. LIPI14-2-Ac024 TaxID=3344875 RepID=UPI0035CF7E48
MKQYLFGAGIGLALATIPAGFASAATLSATELLQHYSVITSGDFVNSSIDIEGNAYVGGNLTGDALFDFGSHGAQRADVAEVVVIGNAAGKTIRGNGGGTTDAVVNGDASGTIGANSTTLVSGPTASALVPDDAIGILNNLSAQLYGLTATATATVSEGKKLNLTAAPTDGVTVYSIDAALLSLANGEINVADNGADLIVINVTGTGNVTSNFVGGGFDSFASKVIWNFVDATDILFDRQFWGQILAPNATVSNNNNLEGALFAKSFVQNGESHVTTFTGELPPPPSAPPAVPLPAGLPLLVSALAGVAMLRRRR